MHRSILVPLDGSPFGEHALPWALAIARRTGALVQIVHKHLPPSPIPPNSVLALDRGIDAATRLAERTYLEQIVSQLTAQGVRAVARLLEGPVVEALVADVNASGAGLVVLATHARGTLSRLWHGSLADDLVHRLSVPTLLVRVADDETDRVPNPVPSVRHILIPLDGTPIAEQVIAPAVALGAPLEARLTLMQVVGSEAEAGWANQYLTSVASRLRRQGLRVHTRIVTGSPVADSILEEAGQTEADLVAIQTHGRSGLARLLHGSIAEQVLRNANVPVLLHRSAA